MNTNTQKKEATWGVFVFCILLCFLLSAVFSTLKAQDYSRADSALLITATDSTYRVYTQYATAADQSAGYTTEQLDSNQTANLLFNMLYDARLRVYVQSANLLFSSGQVTNLKQDIDAALLSLTGKNYVQLSEVRYINQLAPCDAQSANCEAFYTFKRPGGFTHILRIRNTGAVREVNAQGQQVAGGFQGNVKIWAGMQELELTFSAGPVPGLDIYIYQLPAKNNRQRWTTTDKGYYLIRRNRLADTGANAAINMR